MPKPRLVALLVSLSVGAAVPQALAAEVRCHGPYVRAGELPHDGFNTYDELKSRAPTIASCDHVSPLDYCPVTDPWGYVDTFGNVTRKAQFSGPKMRLLVDRTAHRGKTAQLPYGVLWSDTTAKVIRKLKAFGLAPQHGPGEQGSGADIEVGGCGRNKAYVGFLTTFHFDAAGVLQSVKRADEPD